MKRAPDIMTMKIEQPTPPVTTTTPTKKSPMAVGQRKKSGTMFSYDKPEESTSKSPTSLKKKGTYLSNLPQKNPAPVKSPIRTSVTGIKDAKKSP